MSKNKLKKFADLLSLPHVYENFDPKLPQLIRSKDEVVDLKGKWNTQHFGNDNPIILELACGRGEYTEALAQENPENNYIGVDVKGARIWKGATNTLSKGIKNVAFLRTRIEQLDLFLGTQEVSGIWITFPDPFLRESKENKRLTSVRFLNMYKMILKSGAIIHLKTDDPTLYLFTLQTLAKYPGATILYQNDNIYASPIAYPELEYKTWYEKNHLEAGRKIKYVRFCIS